MRIGRLAPWYRWIEYAAFGKALERRRCAYLPRLAGARRILILGEGDGRTLEQLLALTPDACVDVIEASLEMIALAQKRVAYSERVTFQMSDAREVSFPPAFYDAVITNFFLDCFTEPEAGCLVTRLASTLKPQGIWLVGEFAIPESGWPRLYARVCIRIMYLFFAVTTGLKSRALPPVETIMRSAGLHRTEQHASWAGLIVSEVWRPSAEQDANRPCGAPRISPGTSEL